MLRYNLNSKKKVNSMKIESGIEYIKKENKKYHFSEMNVGDSFFAEFFSRGAFVNEYRFRQNLATAACRYAKQTETKFSIRKVDGGFRCWRIA
jgi:hypothetical protein